MLKFSSKFLRPHYFLTLSLIWFDENLAQCNLPSPHPSPTHTGHVKIKVTDLEFSRNKCAVSGELSCLVTGLVSLSFHRFDSSLAWWYILVQNFAQFHPHPLVHVKVKVTVMLKFYVKVFWTSLLLNQMMDLIYILYHDIYWSKVFISTYDGDLGVET